ncbi:MAG: hypothetical protein ABW101_15145 [Candidatus Thiodiazotropha sp.]
MTLRTLSISILVFILSTLGASANTGMLTTGDPLPETSLPDQHGQSQNLEGARLILFAQDKAAGEMIHEVLQDKTQEQLDAQGIVVVSDISRMPGLVTRFFALPSMRDYSYRIMLGYEAQETQWMPRQEDSVTRLTIQDGKITGIDYARSAEQLTGLITPDSADRP